jgi:hypothetical protein
MQHKIHRLTIDASLVFNLEMFGPDSRLPPEVEARAYLKNFPPLAGRVNSNQRGGI